MRRVAALSGGLLLFVAALVASAMLHLDTRTGRRALGDALERFIGGEIRGDLRIGHVDDVGRDRIVARDVLFTSPSGAPALRLDRVEIDPEPGRFLSERTIAIRRARVDGARLWMVEDQDGLRIEEALDSASSGTGPPSVFLEFAGIHFEGLDSDWRLEGAPRFEIDEAAGFLHVSTDRRGEVVMRFDRITGRAEFDLPIADVSAGVRRASGRIHAGWTRMGAFDIELDVGGSPLDVTLDLHETGQGLEARVQTGARGLDVAWLAALGLDLVTGVTGFPGEVEMTGSAGTDRPAEERGDPTK